LARAYSEKALSGDSLRVRWFGDPVVAARAHENETRGADLAGSCEGGFDAADGPGLHGANRAGWFPDDRSKMHNRMLVFKSGDDGCGVANIAALELETRATLKRE
jgi:hypothetical protein